MLTILPFHAECGRYPDLKNRLKAIQEFSLLVGNTLKTSEIEV